MYPEGSNSLDQAVAATIDQRQPQHFILLKAVRVGTVHGGSRGFLKHPRPKRADPLKDPHRWWHAAVAEVSREEGAPVNNAVNLKNHVC